LLFETRKPKLLTGHWHSVAHATGRALKPKAHFVNAGDISTRGAVSEISLVLTRHIPIRCPDRAGILGQFCLPQTQIRRRSRRWQDPYPRKEFKFVCLLECATTDFNIAFFSSAFAFAAWCFGPSTAWILLF
jgi:hypothetical protein